MAGISELANAGTVPNMRELFDCEVGKLGHTIGFGVSVAGHLAPL